MNAELVDAMQAMQSHGWLLLGATGQAVFSSRFVLQWVYSERRGRSAIPLVFWYVSIVGSVLLLSYAIHLHDPVFITAQSGGMLIYLRNLQLRRRETQHDGAEESPC